MLNGISYSNYVVAFVDVLGQKKEFDGIDVLTTNSMGPDFEKKLLAAHNSTVGFLAIFRKWFDDYFRAFIAIGKSFDKIPPEKKEMYLEMIQCPLEHQYFSDSMLAFTSLEMKKYNLPAMNALFGIMASCGTMLLLSFAAKKVFRAGIDLGIGTKMEDGQLYGPALFKAYHLERDVAKYPRIVVGQTVIDYLMALAQKNSPDPNQPPEDLELCKKAADRCLSVIGKDDDGQFILDYLGNPFRSFEEQAPQKKEYDDLYEKAFLFICAEREKWKNLKDDTLAVRYERLYNYFKRKGFKEVLK